MKYHQRAYKAEDNVIGALQERAIVLSQQQGHFINQWQPAKKKLHGMGAMQAWCEVCGMIVVVMPTYQYEHEQVRLFVPAIKGEAVTEMCERGKHVH